jgi:hypothetical protein
MDRNLRLLLAAANDDGFVAEATPLRRRFSIEFGRRGIFVTIGSMDVYLCGEADSAWSFLREPGGLDVQAWRLHLIVGRAPA